MKRVVSLVQRYPWVTATAIVAVAGLLLHLAFDGRAAAVTVSCYCLVVAGVQAWGMLKSLLAGNVGLDVLAITAIVSTVVVGDYWASLVVVLMITGGEALEDYASTRARREVTALLDRSPRTAHRIGADGSVSEVHVDDVAVGDILMVEPGEAVPVDAALDEDEADFDESSITGESLPVTHRRGSTVLSGSVNGKGVVRVRASAIARDSQYQQIVALVEAASNSKAPFVRLADRYAVPFTVVAFLIGGIAWGLSGDATRFAEVLVVATPCPLLIAAPVAFIGGMSRSARAGVIVKSGGVLEQLARVRTVAFDKTGTLTHGKPEVDHVDPTPGNSRDDVLRYAAAAEAYSSHVLAHAIVESASHLDAAAAHDVSETPGHGVEASVEGRSVVVGKGPWVESLSRPFPEPRLQAGQMVVFVAVDGAPAGQIVMSDQLRPNAAQTLRAFNDLGITHTLMLTGDARPTAEHIAGEIGIADVEAGLLPADKVRAISAVGSRPVMMIGDGVNDAPVLAAADVGVAMGAKGSTAASESADVVIMVDDLGRAPRAVAIARDTMAVARQSIWIGISLSVVLMAVAAFGVIPAIIGAALQEAVDLTSILNSLRAVRGGRGEGRRGRSHPSPAALA